MKPKMYRKTKENNGNPKLAAWNPKNDTGGGRVKGTIIGPMSSVGTTDERPSPNQGMNKQLERI